MGGGGGQQAPAASATDTKGNAALSTLQQRAGAINNPEVSKLLASYGSGKMSLQDALSQAHGIKGATADPNAEKRAGLQKALESVPAGGMTGGMHDSLQQQLDALGPEQKDSGDMSAQISDMIASNPLTAQKFAEDQVQNGALTKGLFGAGGVQDKSQGQVDKLSSNLDEDRESLKGKGEEYGLNQNDLKAYGQASGNAARLFGSQEQSLSQSLADRGLSSAPSGAAGASFSGLAGNKNEQLAGIQQGIAQNRINTAKSLAEFRSKADAQRQAENNNLMTNLGVVGQKALDSARSHNMEGAQNDYNQLAGTSGQNMMNTHQNQEANNEAFSQQQATKDPSLGDVLGSAGAIGAGAAAGGMGSSVGSALGKSLTGTRKG